MRLSRYIKHKEVGPGVIGAYHPFGHEFTFIEEAMWTLLEQQRFAGFAPSVLSDLKARRFLVEEGFEDEVLKDYVPGDRGIWEMWLILVQSCNLACQYCVVEGNVKEPDRRNAGTAKKRLQVASDARADAMSPEIAEMAIRKYARLIRRSQPTQPRVTLYGGEPLLNQRTLRHAVPLLRQIQYPNQPYIDPVHILLITNGQIFTQDLAAFFKQYRVTVSVSLDGPKEIHDAARVDGKGNGSYERAARNLKRYIDAGLNCGICTTIGTHNYKHLPEIVEFFADEFGLCVELQVPFEIPYDGGNGYYVPMVEAAPYAMEAFKRLRNRGMMEGLATRRLTQVVGRAFHHRDCSAVGGQIVVSPDGLVGPCHSLVGEGRYFDGDVREEAFEPADSPSFQEWWQRQPVRMEACAECPAIGICGGGCPYNAMVKTGSIWDMDPQQCAYMDTLLDWMLDDVWERVRTDHQSPRTGLTARSGFGSAAVP